MSEASHNIAMTNCYDHPRYYELAFSFRDIAAEVDVMVQCIARHARCPVRRVLELACGPSQHMLELARRGLAFTGLDLSAIMLEHGRAKAQAAGVDAQFVQADMTSFKLDAPVEMAFVALGSLYVNSSATLGAHFDAVAAVLAPGGLYLLDWCVQFEPHKLFKPGGESWDMQDGAIQVAASVEMVPTHPAEQLFEERLTLRVDDAGTQHLLMSRNTKRAIYPQEFLALIGARSDFEFIGWWNQWDLAQPITADTRDIFRPIALLRRR